MIYPNAYSIFIKKDSLLRKIILTALQLKLTTIFFACVHVKYFTDKRAGSPISIFIFKPFLHSQELCMERSIFLAADLPLKSWAKIFYLKFIFILVREYYIYFIYIIFFPIFVLKMPSVCWRKLIALCATHSPMRWGSCKLYMHLKSLVFTYESKYMGGLKHI